VRRKDACTRKKPQIRLETVYHLSTPLLQESTMPAADTVPTNRKMDLLTSWGRSSRTTDRVPQRGSRRTRPAVPASVELPVPPGALSPRFPAQTTTAPSPPAPREGGAETSTRYVAALEDQVRSLTEAVRSLEHQLADLSQRNREIEATHLQLASYRAETDREVAERAAAMLRDAETHAHGLTAAAEQRAVQLEADARARSLELIGAVGAEIDALEREAEKLRRREAEIEAGTSGDDPAPQDDLGVDAATAASIRGQIGDLLRLRESIVAGIRGAVDGFNRELTELERPPLAAAADPADDGEVGTASATSTTPAEGAGTPPEWNGFTIEVQVEPIAGVLEASRIEQSLAEISPAADAHLRAVEGGTASLSVWGLGPQELRDAISSRFPGASCEWVAEDRVTMRLAPAEAA
jgi:hypothetical protein